MDAKWLILIVPLVMLASANIALGDFQMLTPNEPTMGSATTVYVLTTGVTTDINISLFTDSNVHFYVNWDGSLPSQSDYDCSDACGRLSSAGTYFILVDDPDQKSFTLHAVVRTRDATPTPFFTYIKCGQTLTVSPRLGVYNRYFLINSGRDSRGEAITMTMTPSPGTDYDLYTKTGDLSDIGASSYDCRPYLGPGQAETCTGIYPLSIMVTRFSDYGTFDINAQCPSDTTIPQSQSQLVVAPTEATVSDIALIETPAVAPPAETSAPSLISNPAAQNPYIPVSSSYVDTPVPVEYPYVSPIPTIDAANALYANVPMQSAPISPTVDTSINYWNPYATPYDYSYTTPSTMPAADLYNHYP